MLNIANKGGFLNKELAIKNQETVEKFLGKIREYPNATVVALQLGVFHISLDTEEWIYDSNYSKYWHAKDGSAVSDDYFGDIKSFFNRYIKKAFSSPRNSGKIWSESDLDVLVDMIEADSSVNEIATFLERMPFAVAERIQKTIAWRSRIIPEENWNDPVNQLIKTPG